MSSLPPAARVPYEGLWLQDHGLVATSGGVLLAGGACWHPDGIGARMARTGGAALFETATRTWRVLPPMPHPRQHPAAVALPGGRVLFVGGQSDAEPELRTTLVWEPADQRFHEGPPLLAARDRPVAVSLGDGTVVVLGADRDEDFERGTRAEVLWPGARAWEYAGQTARLFHPGPVCASGGEVLIAGGRDNGLGFAIIEGQHLAPPLDMTTEVWSRKRRVWRTESPLTASRDEAQGVTLTDGRILVVGGWKRGEVLVSAEVWDPRTRAWRETGPLALPRSSFTLTALPGGGAAVSGGLLDSGDATAAVELWHPERGTWAPGPALARPQAGHQCVALGADTSGDAPGAFLVVGATRDAAGALSTTWEVWRPGSPG